VTRSQELCIAALLGLLLRHFSHPDRGERAVLQHGQVREEVEVLEHHADLGAGWSSMRLTIVGELDAVDDDAGPAGAPRAG
jgi:hypothetical protein